MTYILDPRVPGLTPPPNVINMKMGQWVSIFVKRAKRTAVILGQMSYGIAKYGVRKPPIIDRIGCRGRQRLGQKIFGTNSLKLYT